jgi:replicative DNA helicase
MFDQIDAYAARPGGVAYGFTDLDSKTNGMQPGALILLAARTSVGKTALACGIALKQLLDGSAVLIASLEQERKELLLRMACSEAEVDLSRVQKGELKEDEFDRLRETGDRIRQTRLWVVDSRPQSVALISAVARRLKRKHGLDLVVIDYLQLIEPEDVRAPRYEQVGTISRRLRAMAKEVAVPVLALCQLSREVENRADSRPRLSDLRESGSLEMDADTVLMLHPQKDLVDGMDVIIGKQRNGPTGEVMLMFRKRFTRFEDVTIQIPQ